MDDGARLAAAVSIALAACGGKIDTLDTLDGSLDAHTHVDAVSDGDSTMTCTALSYSEVDLDASCSITEAWSCNAVHYVITCGCPSATCICSKDDAATIIDTPAVCSPDELCQGSLHIDGIDSGFAYASLCGFPSPFK